METVVRDALRLWVRGARAPDLFAILELVKGELQGRDIRLEFTVDHRAHEQGPGK